MHPKYEMNRACCPMDGALHRLDDILTERPLPESPEPEPEARRATWPVRGQNRTQEDPAASHHASKHKQHKEQRCVLLCQAKQVAFCPFCTEPLSRDNLTHDPTICDWRALLHASFVSCLVLAGTDFRVYLSLLL
jgi:hypothetical protein